MKLAFRAQSVSYSEAIEGQIVQVVFDEHDDDDLIHPRYKSLCLLINYAFAPCTLDAHWGNADQAGAQRVLQYTLTQSQLELWMSDDDSVLVKFSTDNETYNHIDGLLNRALGKPKNGITKP